MTDQLLTDNLRNVKGTRLRSWRRRLDALWGYDVFIAHRRSDAAKFAGALFDALRAKATSAFVDTRIYVPGDSLSDETLRNAARSTVFVLVLSPDIDRPGDVDWVDREIDAYLSSHTNNAKLLVIDFAGTKVRSDHPIRQKVAHFLYLSQTDSSLTDPPSEQVLSAALGQLRNRRRDAFRMRIFEGIAAAMASLAIIASIAAFGFLLERNTADLNARRSLARLLAIESGFQGVDYPQRGLLLAVASAQATHMFDGTVLPEAIAALLNGLSSVGGEALSVAQVAPLAESADGQFVLANSGEDETLLIAPAQANPVLRQIDLDAPVVSGKFAGTGSQLFLVTTNSGKLYRCGIAASDACEAVDLPVAVERVDAVSADGQSALLAIAGQSEPWQLRPTARAMPIHWPSSSSPIRGSMLSPDGRWIFRYDTVPLDAPTAQYGRSDVITLGRVEDGQTWQFDFRAGGDRVEAGRVTFAPDGATLIIDVTRWADNVGQSSVMGVRLSEPDPQAFDVGVALNWDHPRLVAATGSAAVRADQQQLEIYRVEGADGLTLVASFSLDHSTKSSKFSSSGDGCSIIEQTESGQLIAYLHSCQPDALTVVPLGTAADGPPIRFAMSGNGLFAELSTPEQKAVRVWRIGDGPGVPVETWILAGSEREVSGVTFSRDGTIVVGSSSNGELRRWTLPAGGGPVTAIPRTVYRHPQYVVTQLAESADTLQLAHVSGHGGLVVSNLLDGTSQSLLPQVGIGMALSFLGDTHELAFAELSEFSLWNTDTGQQVAAWPTTQRLEDFALSPDNRYVALATRADETLHIMSLPTPDSPVLTPVCDIDGLKGAHVIASANDSFVALRSSGTGLGLDVVQISAGKCTTTRIHETDDFGLSSPAISADKKTIAYGTGGGGEGKILLRELPDNLAALPGPILQTLTGPRRQLTAMEFSPDGRWLAAGDGDGMLFLWRRDPTGQFRLAAQSSAHQSLSPGLNSDIGRLEFDRSSTRLASSSFLRDNVLVWDLSLDPPSPAKIAAFNRDIGTLAFTNDGQLVIGRVHGQVEVWPVDADDLIARACAVAGRHLTPPEAAPYVSPQFVRPCE